MHTHTPTSTCKHTDQPWPQTPAQRCESRRGQKEGDDRADKCSDGVDGSAFETASVAAAVIQAAMRRLHKARQEERERDGVDGSAFATASVAAAVIQAAMKRLHKARREERE